MRKCINIITSYKLYSILASNNKLYFPNIQQYLFVFATGFVRQWVPFILSSINNAFSSLAVWIYNAFADTDPSYFLVGLVFSFFAIVIWISLRYPFWNTQPVLHPYDFWRSFYCTKPYVIQNIPTKTRYFDKTGKIKTRLWSDLSSPDRQGGRSSPDRQGGRSLTRPKIQEMLKMVNTNYIPSDRILLDIQENEWVSLFDDDSFVSSGDNCICTSRTVLSRIQDADIKLNYVDYLTIQRNSKHGREVFSTHEYNVRIMEIGLGAKQNTPSLIKHESGEYEGVVPFIRYKLVQYHLNKLDPWALPIMPPHIQLSLCTMQSVGKKSRKYENTDVINDFAKSFLDLPMFSVKIWAGLPALLRQFSAGHLHMYALRSYGTVLAIYFMRNARTYYEELDGANTLECVSAVSMMSTDDADLFYGGFLLAIRECLKDTQQNYGVLSVSAIGHNMLITERLPKKDIMLNAPCEYILHNMVVPNMPISPENALIIL